MVITLHGDPSGGENVIFCPLGCPCDGQNANAKMLKGALLVESNAITSVLGRLSGRRNTMKCILLLPLLLLSLSLEFVTQDLRYFEVKYLLQTGGYL